jgi:hypothetical protein
MSLEFGSPPQTDFVVDICGDETAFFAKNGYLAIPRMTTDDELEWLRGVYDALIGQPRSGFPDKVFDVTRPYGYDDAPRLGQLLFPERFVPQIRQTSMWRNAKRIATRLLAVHEDAVESWGHLLFKVPGEANETPWHQDEAYWDVKLDYHAVGAWMPLDEAGIDNGCLWFLPGSHRRDVLPHRHLDDDPSVHVLELSGDVDVADPVAVPLAAGGMSFHHPRTLHYSRANAGTSIRRAWANEFQTAPVERDAPADRPWVIDGERALAQRLGRR